MGTNWWGIVYFFGPIIIAFVITSTLTAINVIQMLKKRRIAKRRRILKAKIATFKNMQN